MGIVMGALKMIMTGVVKGHLIPQHNPVLPLLARHVLL